MPPKTIETAKKIEQSKTKVELQGITNSFEAVNEAGNLMFENAQLADNGQRNLKYLPPIKTREIEREYKDTVSNNKQIRKHLKEKDIQEIVKWCMASKETCRSHAEFKKFATQMYELGMACAAYNEAEEAQKVNLKNEINNQMIEVINAAREYIAVHENEKQYTDKGKNRMAVARYVVSADFLKRFIIESSAKKCGLSALYDADSFIFEHSVRTEEDRYNQAAVGSNYDEESKASIDAFKKKYATNNTDVVGKDDRNQYAALLSDDRENNKKVIDAMGKAAADEPDLEPIFEVFDQKINELLKFTVKEDYFKKDYMLKHPQIISYVQRMSNLSADFFSSLEKSNREEPLYSSLGNKYLDEVKKVNPQAYSVIIKKLDVIADLAGVLILNADIFFSVKINNIKLVSKTGKTNDTSCRIYTDESLSDLIAGMEQQKSAGMLSSKDNFDKKMSEKEIDREVYTKSYHFNRKIYSERYKKAMEHMNKTEEDRFNEASKTNKAINDSAQKFYFYAKDNDAMAMWRFYLPSGNKILEKYVKLTKKDMKGNNEKVIYNNLFPLLKHVRFNSVGAPLPEYEENHKWNLSFLSSYYEAGSNLTKKNETYEKCLDDMVNFVTNDENIEKMENICITKSYEDNKSDMEFLIYMSRLAYTVFDRHIEKSVAAGPYNVEFMKMEHTDPEKYRQLTTKISLVKSMAKLAEIDIKNKHQYDIQNGSYLRETFVADEKNKEELKKAYIDIKQELVNKKIS